MDFINKNPEKIEATTQTGEIEATNKKQEK